MESLQEDVHECCSVEKRFDEQIRIPAYLIESHHFHEILSILRHARFWLARVRVIIT